MKIGDLFNQQFTVSEEVYNGFKQTFKDYNPLHADEKVAQAKGFEGRVMHGNILNGFLSYFIGECLPDKNVIIHSQSISFHKPVYLNETLNFNAEITDFSESVNVIVFSYAFVNGLNQKVAKGKIQIGLTK